MRFRFAFAALSVLVLVSGGASLAACGSDGGGEGPSPSPDSGTSNVSIDGGPDTSVLPEAAPVGDDAGIDADAAPEASDFGAPSTVYPAFTVDAPQIVLHGGGHVLPSPEVVTISWAGDPVSDKVEGFADVIGSTAWWKATTSEYGIGPLTSGPGNHVRIGTAPPAKLSFEDLDKLVTDNVLAAWAAADAGAPDAGDAGDAATDAGTGEAGGTSSDGGASTTWPAPTPNTLYAIYLSTQTTLEENGTPACDFLGAYHYSVFVNGVAIAYAIMPRCPGVDEGGLIMAASHEFVEAATDPFQSPLGYMYFDDAHVAQHLWEGTVDEVGDACFFFRTSFYDEPEHQYPVQRTWSNAAAKAGHDPCVPAFPAPYFDVTTFPSEMTPFALNLIPQNEHVYKTRGYETALNQPVTFTIGFFSDADTGGPFDVVASVPADLALADPNTGAKYSNGAAKLSIDKASGVNGEKAHVTVTPTRAGDLKVQIVELTATLKGSQAERKAFVLIKNL
jgi:hypothetical protein